MPRLGVSVDRHFEQKASPADKYGRRIRQVNAVEYGSERSRLFDPILVKLAAGLAIVATVSMTVAIWRLFTFQH